MKMIEINNEKAKQRLLEIMVIFRNLCDKYDLDYSLVGGTLLGAIRHKGFIPWDDDVDIAMERPMYNKMIKIFSKKGVLPNYLKLVGFDVGNSIYPFIKIVDTRTKVIENASNEEMGLWIDIFPLDGLPADKRKLKKIYQRATLLHTLIGLIPSKNEASTKLKGYIKPLAIYISKNIIGFKRINRWCNNLCSKYSINDSDYIGCIIWGRGLEKEAMLKSKYENKIFVTFQKEKFKAMSNYDEYLKNLYGDYMKLPSLKDRQTHLKNVFIVEEDMYE